MFNGKIKIWPILVSSIAAVSGLTTIFQVWSKYRPWTYVLNLLIKLIHLLIKALGYKISLPVWVILLILLAIFCIKRFIALLKTSPPVPAASYLRYRADVIDGIEWHWTWNQDNKFDPFDMLPLCPKCRSQLVPSNEYDETVFNCEHCNYEKTFKDTSYKDVIGKIGREIDRRIRTKEYLDKIG